MNYIKAGREKQLKHKMHVNGMKSDEKMISLRIITKDVRFVHKMYVRSGPLEITCFSGNFLFFDTGLSRFAFLDEKPFCIVNLYHKIHIGGSKRWHS